METHLKAPELVQAQVAVYAESKFPDRDAADVVFRKIGHATLLDSQESKGLEIESAQEYQDYLQFLRSRSESDRQAEKDEASVLSRFNDFSEPLGKLRKKIDSGEAEKLGGGRHSNVYKMNVGEESFVVRFADPQYKSSEQVVHDHVGGSIAGKDIEGLERIEAASYEHGVVISRFVEGKHLVGMTEAEIRAISPEHLAALIQTRMKGSEKGIKFDAIGANIFYDPKIGFTEIDYGVGGKPMDHISAVLQVFSSLALSGAEAVASDNDREEMSKKKVAVYDLIWKYVKSNFPPEDFNDFYNSFNIIRGNQVADAKLKQCSVAATARTSPVA